LEDFEMNIERKETETIDRLFLELSQFTKAKTKRDLQLDALIMAVERKFPGETRFETALRYIREAEAKSSVATAAVTPNAELRGRPLADGPA
jgi:hypothetical protein